MQGALLGILIGSISDFLIQLFENKEKGEKLNLDNYDFEQTLKTAIVGGTFGAAIGHVVYSIDSIQEPKKAFNSDEYLKKILQNESLKENSDLLNETLILRDELRVWMSNNFGDKLVVMPHVSGSLSKRTANANSFDLDITLVYRKESFNTLQEMYNWTFEKLHMNYKDKAIVTKQSKTIGLSFEKEGHEINVDIIPAREINNYKLDKKLNLYRNPKVFWKRGSSFKIDSFIQRSITVNKPEERKVIRLLKLYNIQNNLDIPSILIEQAIVEGLSFTKLGLYSSITDNLLNGMTYLSKKISQEKYTDFGNSNNNLNKKMSFSQRENAAYLLQSDVRKIEKTPYYLKEIFEI